jgi:hypothetical protein
MSGFRRGRLGTGYNLVMDPIIRVIAKVLVPLFFFGLAGSAIVVLISFVEDLKELFGEEE